MVPIGRGGPSGNWHVESVNIGEAIQAAAGTHPSGRSSSLTLARLSHHALDGLNSKETQGNKQEQTLARLAKEAIGSGQLQLSPNQPANGIAQFGMQRNRDVLVIRAKLNERSEYDVFGVGFRRESGESTSMKLPAPATYSKPPLESMPKELIHMMLDNIPNGGTKSRVTSLALSSKGLYALALDKTQAKARCSALLDRLTAIKDIPADQGPDGLGSARLAEFKGVFNKIDNFQWREKLDLIGSLVDNVSNLNFKSGDGFKLMLGLTESLGRAEKSKSVDPEHSAEQTHNLNKTIANLVSKLAKKGSPGTVDAQDRPEVFEKLCSALEGLEGKNGANHTADALSNLASWYFWHPENIGPERFGKLINLADRNKFDASDESKSEIVKSLIPNLTQHDEPVDIANHFNVLCGIGKTIAKDETKADVMTYLSERLNWIDDEDLRGISKNHIDDAVGTINNPVLKAQVAAVTPFPQDD